MKLLHYHQLFFLLLFCGPAAGLQGQCLTAELALIHACVDHPNPNPNMSNSPVEAELLVVRSGVVPVPVADIGIDLPNNGFGPANSDIGVGLTGSPLGCTFKEPSVTGLAGCSNVIPLGPGDTIPADARVVFFTTGTTATDNIDEIDFSNLCEGDAPLYVLQNACERTSGAFANGPGAGNPLRTVGIISDCGIRGFTYNTNEVNPAEGSYFIPGTNGLGNLDCQLPVIPETCPAVDTSFFICDLAGSMTPVPAQELADIYPDEVFSVSFHPDPAAAENNENRITEYVPPGTPADTLYARIISSVNLCITVGELVVFYTDEQAMTRPPAQPLAGCDLEGNGSGQFDLRQADAEIGSGQMVTYYFDDTGTQPISSPEDFVSMPRTIYARAGAGACAGNIVAVPLAVASGPEVMPLVTPESCPGTNNGAIALNASGAAPLMYQWAGDSLPATDQQTGLAAGTYRWSVTDAGGCVRTGMTELTQAEPPQLDCAVQDNVSSPGAADGRIALTLAGGSPPFELQYILAGMPDIVQTVTVQGSNIQLGGLASGDYTIIATDTEGCVADTCRLSLPSSPLIDLMCAVGNQTNGSTVRGTIEVTLAGGTPPFVVTLTGGPVDRMRTNVGPGRLDFEQLVAGTYTVVVEDAAGQTESCFAEITEENCPLRINAIRFTAANCSGVNNTVIQLVLAGNDGPVNTVWTGGNGIEQFNGLQEAGPLPPATYRVQVSDQSGCPAVDSGPIEVQNIEAIVQTVAVRQPSSPCVSDGEIEVNVVGGGVSPYTIVLEDRAGMLLARQADSTVTFGNLPGNTAPPEYRVFTLDALGCSSDTTLVTLTAAAPPVFELLPEAQQQAPSCVGADDGFLELAASGGTPPYTYQWLGYPGQGSGRVLPPGARQEELLAGTYRVEITDDTGCRDTVAITLADPVRPTVQCGATTDAVGTMPGSVQLRLDGPEPPFQVVLLPEGGGEQVVTDIAPGDSTLRIATPATYRVFSINQNGCSSDTCAFVIGEIPCQLTIEAEVLPVDCAGAGRISVTPGGGTGPYRIDWATPRFPPANTVLPITPGTYAVQITDQNGCRLDTAFRVGNLDNAPRLQPDTLAVLPDCQSDTLAIPLRFTGQPPFMLTYSITTGTQSRITDTTVAFAAVDTLHFPAEWLRGGGTITANRVADSRCRRTLNLITRDTLWRPDTIRRFDVTCAPDTFLIGGRMFSPALAADTFLVADGSRCGTRYEVDITYRVPDPADTLEVFVCPGEDFILPGTTEVFNAARSEGEVAFPRPGTCDSLVYVRLDIPPVRMGSFTAGACAGDTVRFGDRFFTEERPSGVARLDGQAATGCDSLVVVEIDFLRTGTLRLRGDALICQGDSTRLRFNYDGGGRVDAVLENDRGERQILDNLTDGSRITVAPIVSTRWQIVAATAAACPVDFTGAATVTVNDLAATLRIVSDPEDFCEPVPGSVRAEPTGGQLPYDFLWNNGAAAALNPDLAPGTYRVEIMDAQGCVVTDSVTLRARPSVEAELAIRPPACTEAEGTLEVLRLTGPGSTYQVSLNGNPFRPVAAGSLLRVVAGQGVARFRDEDQCLTTVDFDVPQRDFPDLLTDRDTVILLGDSLWLDPGLAFPLLRLPQATFRWSPRGHARSPDSLRTLVTPLETTRYGLTVNTEDGCTLRYAIRVEVDARLPVFAPTSFSPNGDGFNDVYQLGLGRSVTALLEWQIFNRWGTLVHEGATDWDGTINGQPAAEAVYVFSARVRMADGSDRLIKGNFVLLR